MTDRPKAQERQRGDELYGSFVQVESASLRHTANKFIHNIPTSSLSFSRSTASSNTHANSTSSAPLPFSSLLASSSQYASGSLTPACRVAATLNATLAAALRTEASGCNKLATSTGNASPNGEEFAKADVLAVRRSVVRRVGLGTSDIEPELMDFSTSSGELPERSLMPIDCRGWQDARDQ